MGTMLSIRDTRGTSATLHALLQRRVAFGLNFAT
jgi:hypothetical protein